MKNKFSLLAAILLLFMANSLSAKTWVVTSTEDTDTEGTFQYAAKNLVSNDTITFAHTLATQTINLTTHTRMFGSTNNAKDKIFTIIGNGVTINAVVDNVTNLGGFSCGAASYPFASGTISNMKFTNFNFNYHTFVGKNLKFINCSYIAPANATYSHTAVNVHAPRNMEDNTVFEGCAFISESSKYVARVQTASQFAKNVSFVSCTFVKNNTVDVAVVDFSNATAGGTKMFTNCVFYDLNTTGSNYTVKVPAAQLVSKGYNVIKARINGNYSGTNPAWMQSTDVWIDPVSEEIPIQLHEASGIYKVLENGTAYKHLPANTSIEGVAFPKKDLLGTTIDYTQPTHSGAVQQTISTGIGNIPVTGVSLSVTEAQTIEIYQTLQLIATITPEDASNKEIAWESSDNAVATVSANGLVTAVGEGTAVIKVITADGGFEATLTVNVNAPTHVTSITLDKHTATLDTYETLQLTAAVLPSDATYPQYTWESSNTAVAAVSASGLVTPIAYGTADITVRTTDGGLTDVCSVTVEKLVYNNGVIFVNEDWFGHRNSSINYLKKDGSWVYEVYRTINNKLLGCTTQYGTIYADKLFLTSKQDEDGDGIGSRFAVCDAQSMESLAEFRTFPEGGDGRAFLGVNEHKGYIGTSNGIYVFDIDNLEFTGRIEDTEGDDNGEGNLPGQNPGLYTGQIGSIRQAGNNVFAIHQVDGLLVINPQTDVVENVLDDYHYATLIVGPDGNLYASATAQQAGGGLEGATLPIIIKINPWTLETSEIAVPEGYSAPYASWGAWRDDAFYASEKENKLYWKTGNDWDSKKIYSYDITNETFEKPIDLSTYDNGTWGIYGSGMGVDPLTNEIYAGVLIRVQDPSYRTLKINPETGDITTYMMRDNWWFPAMALFPDNEAPVIVEELNELTLEADDTENRIYLGDKVTDIDNLDAAIIKSVLLKEGENLISARVWRDSLIVTPLRTVTEDTQTTLTLKANSNGKVVEKTLTVTLKADIGTGYNIPKLDISVYPNPFVDHFVVTASTSTQASITDLSGKTLIRTVLSAGSNRINTSALPSGVYVLKAGEKMVKLVK